MTLVTTHSIPSAHEGARPYPLALQSVGSELGGLGTGYEI